MSLILKEVTGIDWYVLLVGWPCRLLVPGGSLSHHHTYKRPLQLLPLSIAITEKMASSSSESRDDTVIYEPLKDNEIRLFRVFPSENLDDPVRGEITVISLSDAEQEECRYMALSYTWGPTYEDGSHLPHTLDRGGHSLPVTANLHRGLQRFRGLGKLWSKKWRTYQYIYRQGRELEIKIGASELAPRWDVLWVDQICINQADLDERSQQVAMMDSIFIASAQVLIWLGDLLIEEDDPILASRFPLPGLNKAIMIRRDSEEIANALSRTFSVSWFRRRWVIQECACAIGRLQIMYGSLWFSEDTLTHVATRPVLQPRMPIATRNLDKEGIIRAMFGTYTSPGQLHLQTLLWLLHVNAEAECSNDLDVVYALRGAASDGSDFAVDYRQDMASLCRCVGR
jgi:hypothetical protein